MRILTTSDFVKGNIPRREDFEPALEQFEIDCVTPFLGNEVLGAFAYGSINRNDCNVASDIDYLMIVSDGKHKTKVREATKKALDERRVYIQTRVIHLDHSNKGNTPGSCNSRTSWIRCFFQAASTAFGRFVRAQRPKPSRNSGR